MVRFLVLFFLAMTISCVSFKPNIAVNHFDNISFDNNSLYTFETAWWNELQDNKLSNFINTAFQENFDILEAIKRLEQANYILKTYKADRYPAIDLNSSAGYERRDFNNSSAISLENYSLGLTLSYELDLFGKIRSYVEKSRYDLLVNRENIKTAMLTISSQIGSTYFNIISINEKITIAENELESNNALVEIIREKYLNGSVSITDLLKQIQNIENIRKTIEALKLERDVLINKLKILVNTKEAITIEKRYLSEINKLDFEKIDLSIAKYRPDINSAYYEVESAAWDVSAAEANRFPKLSLSASYTFSSEDISELFDNWAANLTANLLAPIFDANKRKNEVERSKKYMEEKVVSYKKVLTTAYNEIAEYIIREENLFKQIDMLKYEIDLLTNTVEKQMIKYLNGEEDFSIFLNDQISLYTKMREYTDIKYEIVSNRINFYKAIGGSWLESEYKNVKLETTIE